MIARLATMQAASAGARSTAHVMRDGSRAMCGRAGEVCKVDDVDLDMARVRAVAASVSGVMFVQLSERGPRSGLCGNCAKAIARLASI